MSLTDRTEERFGIFNLSEAAAWNQAAVSGQDPVNLETSPERWAYSALFPMHDDPGSPLVETVPVQVRVEVEVDQGEIGIAISEPTLSKFLSKEVRVGSSAGRTVAALSFDAPEPGCWLVLRNCAAGITKAAIHSIRTFTPLHRDTPYSVPVPPIEIPAGSHPTEPTEAAAIHRARLEHLSRLGLPLEGRAVLDASTSTGSAQSFFEDRGCRVVRAETDPGAGKYAIVFAYGAINRQEDPIAALRSAGARCEDLLLLEAAVTDHPRPIVQLVNEGDGMGSRPSPAFIVMALRHIGFPFVYLPATAPDHPSYRFRWRRDAECSRAGQSLRCVFVASRKAIEIPQLVLLQPSA